MVPHRRISRSSLWQKSRERMRNGIAPGPRRRDEAVLAEIRASLDNEGPVARTQAAAARLLPQAAKGYGHIFWHTTLFPPPLVLRGRVGVGDFSASCQNLWPHAS